MIHSQTSFGINRWVSELGLSGDEARVFDVLYRKCYRSPYNIHSRQEFYYTHCYEFYGISRRTFMRYLQKYQKCALIVLNKCNEGLFLSTSVTSSPCTPIYIKNKKDKKKTLSIPLGGGGSSREMAAPQPATAATTTDFFVLTKDEQWQLAWEYGQKKGFARDVVSDWFLNRSSVGWIKGKGQKIVGWEADLVAWNRRQAPLAKAENPGAQPIHYTPDPDFQHLVDQICHRYTGK